MNILSLFRSRQRPPQVEEDARTVIANELYRVIARKRYAVMGDIQHLPVARSTLYYNVNALVRDGEFRKVGRRIYVTTDDDDQPDADDVPPVIPRERLQSMLRDLGEIAAPQRRPAPAAVAVEQPTPANTTPSAISGVGYAGPGHTHIAKYARQRQPRCRPHTAIAQFWAGPTWSSVYRRQS